ncbi:MAG: DNA-3-methyladenine glycosylase 2 family protein [Acidobacteriota bacterium]|nr:MAG: DNA-3-methyladenine glycosylase 2 family protein [Acidobacteriota bacterium]
MHLDEDICYRALRTRDVRFDGRFFTGITSTGIYCRPICPARTPRRAHCRFFACAAAAEQAGYRPCRRCRPETSPGTPAWQGTSSTVNRALQLIDEGALDEGGVEDLAARLGIGDRHLRRLFDELLGTSPLAVALSRRVHFAKRLLEETLLPAGDVALASGFHNTRRFNAAFRKCFGRTPSEVRRAAEKKASPASSGRIELRLAYRAPLAWQEMLDYFGPRAIPGVEQVRAGTYRRTVCLDDAAGLLEVASDEATGVIVLRAPVAAAPRLAEWVARVRAQFDLSADPAVIDEHLNEDPALAGTQAPPGLRVPGAFDRFELAVRAILGQQITVRGATKLSGRLVRAFGRPFEDLENGERAQEENAGPCWLFPRAADLARASASKMAEIGMPTARAATIHRLSCAVAAGETVLEPAADLDEAVRRLVAIDGIGEWTAHYVAMRALREPDAFPSGDLGLRRALAAGAKPLSARALSARAEAWRPWRAYAAVRLWYSLSR